MVDEVMAGARVRGKYHLVKQEVKKRLRGQAPIYNRLSQEHYPEFHKDYSNPQ